MKEQYESKLDELLDEALSVIKNHPATGTIEANAKRANCFKVYWSEQRSDGQHHALLYLNYGNRRADIGSKIRIWIAPRDVHILDFTGDRVIPVGDETKIFCLDFTHDLTGEVDGIVELLEYAQHAYSETLAGLEASLS